MLKRWSACAALVLLVGIAAVAAKQTATPPKSSSGWTLPPNADDEKNPFAGKPAAVATGKQLYDKTCKRCHGPGGRGDGPDADPDSMEDMDLTVAKRASRNPDGVVFYKIYNGRKKPKMPAQKDDLTKDQIWQIVSYVQTLREKS